MNPRAQSSDQDIELTILLPCLNEAKMIELCVRKAMACLDCSGAS
jgi:hypothetical protein